MQSNAHAALSVSNIRGVVIKYLQISLIVSCVTKRRRRVFQSQETRTVLQSIHANYIHRHSNQYSASPTRRGPVSYLSPSQKPKTKRRKTSPHSKMSPFPRPPLLLTRVEGCVRHQSRRSRTHTEQCRWSFISFQVPRSPLHL